MKNNQSDRKKSSIPFRLNRKSFFGVMSLVYQELLDKVLTKINIKLPKEEEVLNLVRKKSKQNSQNSQNKLIIFGDELLFSSILDGNGTSSPSGLPAP